MISVQSLPPFQEKILYLLYEPFILVRVFRVWPKLHFLTTLYKFCCCFKEEIKISDQKLQQNILWNQNIVELKHCGIKTLWNQEQNEVQGYFAPPSPPEGKIANENEDKRAEIF